MKTSTFTKQITITIIALIAADTLIALLTTKYTSKQIVSVFLLHPPFMSLKN